MHLAFLEVINEDSFEIKCLGRPWKQSPIPDWQKSNFNLYFIQPAGPLYSLLYTLTAWWLWGKQGCGEKTNSKMGRYLCWEGRIQNYPHVCLGFVFLCFRPLPAFPSGLLKTLHSSVGLKKILGTQCGRQDDRQGKPWEHWSVMPRALWLHPQTPSWFAHSSCLLLRKSHQDTRLYGLGRKFSSQF